MSKYIITFCFGFTVAILLYTHVVCQDLEVFRLRSLTSIENAYVVGCVDAGGKFMPCADKGKNFILPLK